MQLDSEIAEPVHDLHFLSANAAREGQDGVPIVGFTWYSLTDRFDWDIALREECNRVHPVGLYDQERQPRRVGREYRRLIDEWRDFLPTGSSALMLV